MYIGKGIVNTGLGTHPLWIRGVMEEGRVSFSWSGAKGAVKGGGKQPDTEREKK